MPPRVVLLGVNVQFESARCEGFRIPLSFALSSPPTYPDLFGLALLDLFGVGIRLGAVLFPLRHIAFALWLQVVRGRVVCHAYLLARSRLPPRQNHQGWTGLGGALTSLPCNQVCAARARYHSQHRVDSILVSYPHSFVHVQLGSAACLFHH